MPVLELTPQEILAAQQLARVDLYSFSRWMFLQRKGYRWQRARHHALICDALMRVFRGECKRLIINVPPRYSKAIDCATAMWTPGGWKRAGDIQLGDRLVGSDGQWTTVVGVHPQGVKPAYTVRFSDGSELVACGDHRWSVRLRDKDRAGDWSAPWRVKTTDELRGDLVEADGRRKWRIPVLSDSRSDDVDLPLDPYLLGCWLGDGHTHQAAITTMDPEIIGAFSAFDPRPHTHQSAGRATTYGLRGGFVTILRSLGVLGCKHIPRAYMLGSHAQRLALLQGLCDTDGWVGAANGQQGVCFSDRTLSDDVRSLISSLGGVWRGFESDHERGRRSYKTFLSMPLGDVAFRLPRKVAKINERAERNTPRRFVASIEPTSAREMVCFTVDAKDSLFCAGRDFVVTHNTELAVVNFIAWAFGQVPDCEFIHASYSGALAGNNSANVRELVQHEAYRAIFPGFALSSDAQHHWKTTAGGVMYAVGAGGTITGFGAGKHRPGFGGAIIIDDPHKADEATSDVVRQGVIDWFQNTLESRKNSPDTPIIVIMQRLHEKDLAGWLLAGGNGEEWERLCLSAWQDDGTPLWPEKHDAETLERMERAAPYVFAGQYRQRPAPPAGGTIKPDQMQVIDSLPAEQIEWVRAWDLAASVRKSAADDPDWTCGVKLGRMRDGRLIIGDVVRLRAGPDERDAAIRNTAARDSRRVRISLPQDPGQAGKTQALHLTRMLAGYPVHSSPESGDKYTRALPFAAQLNVGNVLMLRAPWNDELVAEMRMFPNGAHDDQVDGLSRAFEALMGGNTAMLDFARQQAADSADAAQQQRKAGWLDTAR